MSQSNLSANEAAELKKALKFLVGGSLLGLGLAKRSTSGLLLAGAGCGVLYSAFVEPAPQAQMRRRTVVRRSATFGLPQNEVFAFWENPENLAKVMPGVESIRPTAEGKWHWTVRPLSAHPVEWESELLAREAPHFLHWKALDGAPIEHEGSAKFRPAAGGRGTEVLITLKWKATGVVSQALTKMIGKGAGWEAAEALRRAKQLLETGELSTATMSA